MKDLNIKIIIPARFDSVRLPGKLLLKVEGMPIIQHVFQRCLQAKNVSEVWIAADEKIAAACKDFTDNIFISQKNHTTGTERITEAAEEITADFIINVQGDELLMDPQLIDHLAQNIDAQTTMITAAYKTTDQQIIKSHSKVKVVLDKNNYALYFSRSPIPFYVNKAEPCLIHYGIYGYSRSFLANYKNLEPSPLQQAESLEQLRVLQNGLPIKVVIYHQTKQLAIDTMDDYNLAKQLST